MAFDRYNDIRKFWGTSFGRRVKRSYDLPVDLAERITETAQSMDVSVSDLAGYLLHVAMEQLETGELKIETRPAPLNRIVWPMQQE